MEVAPLGTPNSQATPATFRFVDLPAETRNQIYRYVLVRLGSSIRIGKDYYRLHVKELAILFVNRLVYSEAMPIFLSKNTFSITGQRKELNWLRRMRPEGRRELRKVTLVLYRSPFSHDYGLFNALSLCPQMHLSIQTRTLHLASTSMESHKNLRNMHGFAAVTWNPLPKETDLCATHRRDSPSEFEVSQKQDQVKRLAELLRQFQAPCVGRCRVHRGREGTHTQATIHLAFSDICYYCC